MRNYDTSYMTYNYSDCLNPTPLVSVHKKFSVALRCENLWAGEDLNLRRLTPTGLQPVPFGHSGTDPELVILALV